MTSMRLRERAFASRDGFPVPSSCESPYVVVGIDLMRSSFIPEQPDGIMNNKISKIYIAGHRGLVGSALVRQLLAQGYVNLVCRSHGELDLCRFHDVETFLSGGNAGICVPCRGQGGWNIRQQPVPSISCLRTSRYRIT